jgi:hypothetical protein
MAKVDGSILSIPASSIIILSNLIVGSRFKDRLVEITIFFFKMVSIDLAKWNR